MISCDTNILFPALDRESVYHEDARRWLSEHASRQDFCLCEQVLMELYCLLRNPAVCASPLNGRQAVSLVTQLRSNPNWRIVDVVQGSGIMEQVWQQAGGVGFRYGRIFDARLAAILRHHGVTDFATRNTRDFRACGFTHVWDPLSSG